MVNRFQISFALKLALTPLPIFFITPVLAQNAPQNNIVVDSNAHQGGGAPNFVQSSNGTDVLNIVKPTNGGVSHNKFLE